MARKFCRRNFVYIAVAVGLIVCYWNSSFIIGQIPFSMLCPWTDNDREFIVKELHNVIMDMHEHAAHQPWTERSKNQLNQVIRLFDGNYNPSSFGHSAISKKERKVNPIVPEFCPEHFENYTLSEPFFMSGSWFKDPECEQRETPVEKLLTIALYPTDSGCTAKTAKLLASIYDQYPKIQIIVAVGPQTCALNTFGKYLDIVKISNSTKTGHVLNQVIDMVRTPYVLIGRGLEILSRFDHFKRQISVLSSDPLVKVVGASFRNKTGHWQMGCYQTRVQHYQLEYREGYYASRNECVYCEYLVGAFIARTSLFKTVRFDEDFDAHVVFDDFFLELKRLSHLVLNCPDAMYFADDETVNEKINNRLVWLPLVKKRELNLVILADREQHRFSCEEVGMRCDNLNPRSGFRFMPICCADRLMAGLRTFHQICKDNRVLYYVNGGTLLGAIKFRNIIPWDFDGDAVYYLQNLSLFENFDKNLQNKTVTLESFHSKWFGYFQVKMSDIFIELSGLNATAVEKSGQMDLFRKIPTLVRIRNEWFYGPPSPGLYARNFYGTELFRHANSWHVQGHRWDEPYFIQAKFSLCDNPNHHSCYWYLPTDGSFDFILP